MKVNGYRIELAEIEVVIAAYPAIELATVLVRNGQLVAYLLLKKGYSHHKLPSNKNNSSNRSGNKSTGNQKVGKGSSYEDEKSFHVAELREFIARSLTSYMIPK